MNVSCGKDIIDISKAIDAEICTATEWDVDTVFTEIQGVPMRGVFSSALCKKLGDLFEKYESEIISGLPEPTIRERKASCLSDDEVYHWKYYGGGRLELGDSLEYQLNYKGDAEVKWTFPLQQNPSVRTNVKSTAVRSFNDHVMPTLKKLLDRPKPKDTFFGRLGASLERYPYEVIQSDISETYEAYRSAKSMYDNMLDFREKYLGKSVLKITIKREDQEIVLNYLDGVCGFDITQKKEEIETCLVEHRKHLQKLSNSKNAGEEAVEYALKWFLASTDGRVTEIKNDCESGYRYNCILLCKPDFINEPQEYDHILVSSTGVVLIETKHWKGRVEIRSDGKWIRDVNDDGHKTGVESPQYQMRRHETLMKQILPNVPVHSLLCFTNNSVIIDGQSNFAAYPIVYVEQLGETLEKLLLSESTDNADFGNYVNEIEKHKISRT